MRTRRSLLAGLGGAVLLAGCTGQQGDTNNGEQTEINAPEPDTLQDQPILYHGQTYQLNNEAYTVPDTLDRGPQTITTDQGQTIQAYISNEEPYLIAIANNFEEGRGTSISEHYEPAENGIRVDGDTIYIESETEKTGNDLSSGVAGIAGTCAAAIEQDEIPYNFDITINDGNGRTHTGRIDSDMSQEYLDDELPGLEMGSKLGRDMGL